MSQKSYVEELTEQYIYAIGELEEVKCALKKDPLDPRYTPRNTRYKYRSGYSTVQCAAVLRIGNLEKQQHVLRSELRQRLTWLEDFIEKLANLLNSGASLDVIYNYLGLDYLRNTLKEVNLNARAEEKN
jgi:hypothetical protein